MEQTVDKYQTQASRTLIEDPGFRPSNKETMLAWCALGITGEAGEVADIIKKAVFHRHVLDADVLAEELGDVLWYIASICTILDVSMDDVMERNIEKLQNRYPQGYSSEASINREKKDI